MTEEKQEKQNEQKDHPKRKDDSKKNDQNYKEKSNKKSFNDELSDDESKETKKLDELQKQLESMEDKYLRSQAEIVNMQQRNKKELDSILKYDGQSLAHDIVPIIDDLERALQIKVSDEVAENLKHGVEMVFNRLNTVLKEHNVEEIEALNKPFDPNLHQAVKTVPADDEHKADTVVEVLQKGYMIKDRVLRPAMVVVAQ